MIEIKTFVVGQLEESRTALETRRALSVAKNSHGSRLSLQGSIASIDGVLDCLVLENKSNASTTIQGVSLISHSVAICVYGGADEAIAEMIYNKLDAGCGTNGGTTVTYTSSDGVPNSYQIVRPTPTNLYVEVTINETGWQENYNPFSSICFRMCWLCCRICYLHKE